MIFSFFFFLCKASFCDTHASERKPGFDETEWDYVLGRKLYSVVISS